MLQRLLFGRQLAVSESQVTAVSDYVRRHIDHGMRDL